MTFVKKIVLVFSFICIVGNIFSQTFNFKNYNTEQVLPQSQVLSIYQDAKGYVWFGTNSGGVGKFDGNKFTNLSINDGLINNVVYSITGNKKGELFFGTGKGLSVYNQFTFKNFNEKNGLTNAAIYKVICYENKIWIGTDKGVFIYFDGKVTAFSPDSILNNSSVSSIFADKENNLWFGTLQNGIVYFDVKNKIFKHLSTKDGLTNNFVFSISQMQNGIILVGTQTGLNKINSKFEVMPADEIESNRNISFSCIEKSEADKFYFGTYSEGLMDFDFNEQKRKFFKGNNGLTNNAILCVLKDKEGNLWVGTDGAGAFKYFNKKFVYYTVGNGLPDKYISAVSEDEAGNLWIAMPSKGLAKIFKNEISYYKADFKQGKSLPDNTVNSILSAKDGKIYFGTQDGLCIFEKDNFKIPDDKLIRHNYIYSLFEDSKKNIWIGTSKGAFMFNGIEVSAVESINKLKQKGIPLMILSITEDKAGNIWMGTDNGVIRIADNKSIRFNDEKTFINGRVGVCISDEKGNVWMGTEHGLYNYSKNLFKKIAVEYNLQPAFINFLQIDKKNNLIIGSNNGIDILNLNEYYNNKKAVRHLGKDDGLLSLESNSNASAIDKNNRILIGTVNGLEIYDSELDILNQNEASINITNTKLFFGQENILDYADGVDSTSLLPKNLVLTYTKNNITFQYIGISLMAPEKVLYRFKLEGIDSDWSPPVNKTEATYPSLPAGNYTFFVKAANNDGLWNKTPASFSFSILPPWYNTWWFYTSCVFVLVCGIIIYNNYRTKKLIADKIRLENTVNIRTKELRDEKEKVELINVEVNLQKQEIEHKMLKLPILLNMPKIFKKHYCLLYQKPKRHLITVLFYTCQKIL